MTTRVHYEGQSWKEHVVRVDYLVLAEAAAAVEGRHYIHGAGWDALLAASFPATHPLMSVAVRLRVPWTDTNQPHALELDVVDADEQSILREPLRANVNVGRPPHLAPGSDQVVCLALNLVALQFVRPGAYVVKLTVEGAVEARSPFNVLPLPGAARSGGPAQ
jgi:hypothetical protein